MSHYPNLLAQPFSLIGSKQDTCWTQETQLTQTKKQIECPKNNPHQGNQRQMEGLRNCCYFLDLKTGCQLIALAEALSSMLQIFQSYSDLYEKEMTTKSVPSFVTTTEFSKVSSHRHVHAYNPMYNLGMGTMTILSALLLFLGARFERKILLLVWIYTSVLCILIFMLHTLVTDPIAEHMVLNVISLALESYFIVVVFSFYLHLHKHHQRGTASEIEVLYTGTSEA